ncbi:hypothetical protein FNZ56_12445 [Pseudoluteimonas lycopersici]|uniref:Uncharacterized protein n=1 Tax=Pseudoluteimonas lycopersici TaxID=1324796 RepID=A0A516V841_9GAMM|nr:hypothetical protein [Lysobacter lycopersici]QDQ74634.1 hypothetical protein FNZ56_12445 [Lysobacter lycopersici]
MNLRNVLIAMVVLGLAGWWFSPHSPRVPAPPKHVDGTAYAGCPLPPLVARGAPPLQSDVPASLAPFRLEDASLQPLAGFSVEARVLSRKDYGFGREAEFSPTDLALGWGRMGDDAVLDRLDIRQSSRWYRYRWRGDPPIPPREIIRSSANMHMIPADPTVAAALHAVRPGQRVRIDGWLVQVDASDGWHWRSSLTREDTGSGACEVVYVCSISRE